MKATYQRSWLWFLVSILMVPTAHGQGETILGANFMNGNTNVFSSRIYLWNPSDNSGAITVRVFTLPLTSGTNQELTTEPLFLRTLGARSALNLKLAEDILTPMGIALPYTDNGGNLKVELTIGVAGVQGVAQVFSGDFAFGTYPLQETLSTSSASPGSPTVLVANTVNGNTSAFFSRVNLFNPSPSAADVAVRVFTLPEPGGTAQELSATPLSLGVLGARSALSLQLDQHILTPLGITTPYISDGGWLALEFTIQAANVSGVAFVGSNDLSFGSTYPLQVVE